MRDQLEIEEMAMRFSSVVVEDDDGAIGVQEALRWVLYPAVEDSSLLGMLPG